MDGSESSIAHLEPELTHVVGEFVPSGQVNYKTDEQGNVLTSFFRTGVSDFKYKLRDELERELADVELFPTANEVHVAITFGVPPSRYKSGDIDNKCKTILDSLKGPVYEDDHLVRVLWADKKLTAENENWCLISVKILN